MSETQEKIKNLKIELLNLEKEINLTEEKNEMYSESLVKSLIKNRLEVLKTSRAILNRHIYCLNAELEDFPVIEHDIVNIPFSASNQKIANSLLEEIESQTFELELERKEAEKYSGGLVKSLKLASIATKEQTISMLQLQYYCAKYGLYPPTLNIRSPEFEKLAIDDISQVSDVNNKLKSTESDIIKTELKSKRFQKGEYDDFIWCDFEHHAIGLEKPARAIKGIINFNDLFGETQLTLKYTIDHEVRPNQIFTSRGVGFEYNQFNNDHRWVRSKTEKDIQVEYIVTNILFQDGSRVDYQL